MTSISNQENFSRLFNRIKGELIYWNNTDTVGVSVLKDYPPKGKFTPALTQNGDADSKALVKVGYYLDEIKENKVFLFVKIDKVSKYLLSGHWDFDPNDKDSPTLDSVELSKNSKQPINLEDPDRFELNLLTNKILDKDKNKSVTTEFIINDIFEKHLKTLSLSASYFRFKMIFQKNIVDKVGPINDFLKIVNFKLFGRTMRETEDFGVGIFKTYSRQDMIDSTAEKRKILGSDFPITNQSAVTFVCLASFIFLLEYLKGIDVLGIVALIRESQGNVLFQGVLLAAGLLIVDKLMPLFIFSIINLLIKLRMIVISTKIKFGK